MLRAVPIISSVTLTKLSVGNLAQTDAEHAARQAVLQHADADFDPLPFDDCVASGFGRVPASLRDSRRTVTSRSDAMVAAIAIANDLPLHTANPSDFRGIDGLDVRAMSAPPAAER